MIKKNNDGQSGNKCLIENKYQQSKEIRKQNLFDKIN